MACKEVIVAHLSTLKIFSLFILFMSFMTWDKQQRLDQYFAVQKVFKLASFEAYKKKLNLEEKERLELWESFLTGRSGPVSKWIKEDYKQLGLNHVFSPSGFHLSAFILPLTILIPSRKFLLSILFFLALIFLFIPGQWAIKRVLHLKIGQQFLGMNGGFFIAICIDIFSGALFHSPLSFAFSYLFLSLIMSKNIFLNAHFYFSQMLIFYFSSDLISPLLIFLSPLLNILLTIAFPFLVILSFPNADWSFESGLTIMKILQSCVEFATKITTSFPLWEINLGFLLITYFIYRSNRRMIFICLFLMSHNLDMPKKSQLRLGSYDYTPRDNPIKMVQKNDYMIVYYKEGKCMRDLRYGVWWEKCSPKKRSTRKNKIKKLSFPS